MKSIKELEAEINKEEQIGTRGFLIGKKDALKDVKKLIDEIKKKYHDEIVLVRFIEELKARIEGK